MLSPWSPRPADVTRICVRFYTTWVLNGVVKRHKCGVTGENGAGPIWRDRAVPDADGTKSGKRRPLTDRALGLAWPTSSSAIWRTSAQVAGPQI